MQIDSDHKEFIENGYLHLSSLIPQGQCNKLLTGFENEVKSFESPLLREHSVDFETHSLSTKGLMENPLLDVHRINANYFPTFVNSVFNITSNPSLLAYINKMVGFDNALVQTTYFEGSKGTVPHFDKYFLAPEEDDPVIGIWVALEDIHESAGRFYIYPKSHDFKNIPDYAKKNISLLLKRYKEINSASVNESKKIIDEIIELACWKKLTPTMKKGDAILFSSSILHGSDVPRKEHRSRNSLTAHFINTKRRKIRFGSIVEELKVINIHGLQMHQSDRYKQYPIAS